MARISKTNREKIIKAFYKVIDYIENSGDNMPFICVELMGEDDTIPLEYFKKQRPSKRKHKEFTKHESFIQDRGDYKPNCWWNTTLDGNKQRVLFLEYLIEKLKQHK